MCSIIADSENHRFVIGSCSIPPSLYREEEFGAESKGNELHFVSYSEDANRIDVDKVFKLPDSLAEVVALSSSPYNRSVVAAAISTFKSVSTGHEESKA